MKFKVGDRVKRISSETYSLIEFYPEWGDKDYWTGEIVEHVGYSTWIIKNDKGRYLKWAEGNFEHWNPLKELL